MKRILLTMTMTLLSSVAHAQQPLIPDGMGGYIINNQNGNPNAFSDASKPENSLPFLSQRLELQRQQIEYQRLQNELLRRSLEQEKAATQAGQQAPQGGNQLSPELRSWQAENPWFGSDKAKTEFALLYVKQLRQEQPALVGKPFYDAVSAKVSEVFGTSKMEQSK